MKNLLKEFKDFIMTGNLIDLAVAVLLATAVGAVVSSFTEDVMMPVVGHFAGDTDFSEMKFVLDEAVVENGEEVSSENAIMYGKWINTIIDLLIVGFVLFMIVKAYNKVKNLRKKEEEEAAPDGPTTEEL